MTLIRMKGFTPGDALGTVSITVGELTESVAIPAFQSPSSVTVLPRISDGFDTDTFTVDLTGLSGIVAYDWHEVGGSTLATSPVFDGAGHGGKWVVCDVTCDQGTLSSPPIMIYATTMTMGMDMPVAMDPAHLADDALVVAMVPHAQATHVAVADGDWTNPATWLGANVPANGACILIPHGRTVRYDQADHFRLNWIRVDGTLEWALDRSTKLLVETMVGTRGSEIIMGTQSGRLPAEHTAEITISGRDYTANTLTPTDMNVTRDPGLWGRGIVSQGVWRIWGADKLQWSNADPIEAGATSLTLHQQPAGWSVGDEIVIFGTKASYARGSSPMEVEDETRIITALDGNLVSWADPLVHSHKNPRTGSSRTDLYPKIMLKQGRNIIVQSEVTSPVWRRGHTASAHHSCTVDYWDASFLNLGRTDKSRPVGKRLSTGEFYYNNGENLNSPDTPGSAFISETLTPQSNLAARYPIHMHHVGFHHMAARPIVNSCYVQGTPGWGMVHHSCDVDFEQCGIYDFWGAGMVAESGDEVGGWIHNIAGYSPVTDSRGRLHYNAKLTEGNSGLAGDNFKLGYGFAYRGRAVRATGNVAVSCPWGHTFFHRGNPNDDVFPTKDLLRVQTDIGDVGRIAASALVSPSKFRMVDYPIIHFAENEAVGVLGGMHVTKQAPHQSHDVNIKLKRFKSWGFWQVGADIEYIGTYILDGFDLVGSDNAKVGIQLNPNTFQVAVVNARVEGTPVGFRRDAASTAEDETLFDDTNDPRWMDIGNDYVDVTTPLIFVNDADKAGRLVTYTRDDFDDTAIDYDLSPSDTYPLVLATWDGQVNSLSNEVTNADGKKISNLGAGMNISPKLWSDFAFLKDGLSTRIYSQFHKGYWTADIGNGPEDVLVVQELISDPLTARPYRYLKFVQTGGTPTSSIHNGTFDYSPNPTIQADKLAVVAANGSVDIDVVSGATGGNGTDYTLVAGTFIAPDHGKASFDFATGVVTYKPDRDFEGTDEMYVFVESGGQSATVRIDVLIGAGGVLTPPAAATHFEVSDHGDTDSICVTLLAPPAAGGRRIELVQYSTDGGTTWRRLTHRWVQAAHKVSFESDETPISPGSYDVRIRYKTNYDYALSDPSADMTVVAS